MSCPSGLYPAGRTNKEEVLCCVDKQGCWRSACGRSLVSFYPGWDGSLETDLSMWKQEKILIVCSRVNIFFLFGSWCGPPVLFPSYSRTPLPCVSKHSSGGTPWKALDAEEDRSQPLCLCPHTTHPPFYSLRNLLQPHLLFPSQDRTLKPWASRCNRRHSHVTSVYWMRTLIKAYGAWIERDREHRDAKQHSFQTCTLKTRCSQDPEDLHGGVRSELPGSQTPCSVATGFLLLLLSQLGFPWLRAFQSKYEDRRSIHVNAFYCKNSP